MSSASEQEVNDEDYDEDTYDPDRTVPIGSSIHEPPASTEEEYEDKDDQDDTHLLRLSGRRGWGSLYETSDRSVRHLGWTSTTPNYRRLYILDPK